MVIVYLSEKNMSDLFKTQLYYESDHDLPGTLETQILYLQM